jgi:hypothetical protein
VRVGDRVEDQGVFAPHSEPGALAPAVRLVAVLAHLPRLRADVVAAAHGLCGQWAERGVFGQLSVRAFCQLSAANFSPFSGSCTPRLSSYWIRRWSISSSSPSRRDVPPTLTSETTASSTSPSSSESKELTG